MTLELHVTSGARTGHQARFDGDRVVVGRDPAADLRLDAVRDRDASARHLELRRRDGAWHLRDLGSTNGTFVNGRRVDGEVTVCDGDRIACGADGPTIVARLRTVEPPAPRGRSARAGIAIVAAATLTAAAIATTVVVQRRADARVLAADALRAAADSARVAAAHDVRALAGLLAASDSARLAAPTEPAPQPAPQPAPGTAAVRAPVALAATSLDVAAVARSAARAVALVAVEAADGTASSGTAFGVDARGLLVTNRHVVLGHDGSTPRRIAVKYADTDAWLEARLVRTHPDADVATVQIVEAGRYPTVARIADADPPLGSEIVVLGFPVGAEAPHERATADGMARVAVFRGLVSKVAEGTIVVDAYAGHGSSGSPVLDARGSVVGVVYGGPREAVGRVALAASSTTLRSLLR